ncbi:MAG: repressor LexA [Candidatus Marinimicrobia bacterium]|nr:repressor LexA [Candidatus Neomarinimicrobiota bacterium]MBT7376950.1 repressor LexA [Candidatus Neomarinimicrobiota bacterium]
MNTFLSPKKQRFVDFVESFTANQNRPPTFVEIMDGLDINSLGTINWYVKELEKVGVLKRMNGFNGKRSLSVLERHMDNALPLLGLIAAGYPLEVFENTESVEVPSSFVHPDNYVLKVNGPSMQEDGILDGDFVIIKKTETANNGDTVVAYVNDEATLKEYHYTNKKIELHPKNAEFDIIKINERVDFRIGGIVLGVIRKY